MRQGVGAEHILALVHNGWGSNVLAGACSGCQDQCHHKAHPEAKRLGILQCRIFEPRTPDPKPIFEAFRNFLEFGVICGMRESGLNCETSRFWTQVLPAFVKNTIPAYPSATIASILIPFSLAPKENYLGICS